MNFKSATIVYKDKETRHGADPHWPISSATKIRLQPYIFRLAYPNN